MRYKNLLSDNRRSLTFDNLHKLMVVYCNNAVEPSSIENDAHGIEKLLAKSSSKLKKLLHSEVNLLIQHIIVQDQDGQNDNT